MTNSEFDRTASQLEEADATDLTRDDDDANSTDMTQDEDDENSTDMTQDEEIHLAKNTGGKVPSSEIVVRTIAVERAPLVDLPADTDAAFDQWLAGSGLAPSRH